MLQIVSRIQTASRLSRWRFWLYGASAFCQTPTERCGQPLLRAIPANGQPTRLLQDLAPATRRGKPGNERDDRAACLPACSAPARDGYRQPGSFPF